jgi:hypothetical protein
MSTPGGIIGAVLISGAILGAAWMVKPAPPVSYVEECKHLAVDTFEAGQAFKGSGRYSVEQLYAGCLSSRLTRGGSEEGR